MGGISVRRYSPKPWVYLESWLQGRRCRAEFAHVQAFVLFIGSPRSGHSLVGSLLNAHPNALIAHELDVLRFVDAGYSRNQIYWLLKAKDRQFNRRGCQWTGYDYQVPNQWQGRYENLQVIGDKRGGMSTHRLTLQPELLPRLEALVKVPVRLIHIVRHPLDNIATMLRHNGGTLEDAIANYFAKADTNYRLLRQRPADVLTASLDDVVAQPLRFLTALCEFLKLPTPGSYIADCASIVLPEVRRTRDSISWPAALRQQVIGRAKQYPFLAALVDDSSAAATLRPRAA
jgi:hypothetical protein